MGFVIYIHHNTRQHSGAPLVIDVHRPSCMTPAERGAVALLELMLWGNPDAPLVGGTHSPGIVARWLSQALFFIKTASIHRLLILACQRLRVEVCNVSLSLKQEGHPGPWAAGRHLECTDACRLSMRRLLVSPRAAQPPRLHLLRRPFMVYYGTDTRVAHTLEADLAGVDVEVSWLRAADEDGGHAPGPFVQYNTDARARRPKRARGNVVMAASQPPPLPPAPERHVLLQQWSASAALTVAPRGTVLQHASPAPASATTPGGLQGVPEEDDADQPTTTAQLTVCIQVSLSACVPVLTPAATACAARIAERLIIFDKYARYWARRPLTSVHEARRLWWKYAGASVHEAARKVARRNVPLAGLAERHRLRMRHARLYAAAHARGVDAANRLLAFEGKLTLEQVCNFRLMAGLRDSPYLRGSVPRRSAAVQVYSLVVQIISSSPCV